MHQVGLHAGKCPDESAITDCNGREDVTDPSAVHTHEVRNQEDQCES